MAHTRSHILPLLLCVLMPASGAFARGRGNAPLRVETHVLKKEPFARTLSAVGTLRANEVVVLVSELSRRLVEIHFDEGSEVSKGDLLFKLDDSDLVAELAEIDARIRLAQANLDRAASLLPTRAISQQEFELAGAEVDILQAQRNAKTVEIDKTRIRAPFTGIVGVRQVSEGAYVSPSLPLITLQDVSSIKVDFPLPERYAPEVRSGQPFTFTMAGNGAAFNGTISVVEPAIDTNTRSLQIRGLCENPKGLLPGGFAQVSLELDGEAPGFMIPSQAIVPSPRGQGVYLIRDGKADLRPVEIGMRTAARVQILRGLEEGDEIATSNLLRIRTGLEVVTESAQP